jgi:CheY-like chemotaxis protein
MRVMVIDDHADLRESLRRVLADAGYEAATAADGKQALALQASFRADVIVTDIFMPEMDGIEVVQAFRSTYPGVRIIAMSGAPRARFGAHYLGVAETLGAEAILNKPFKPQALLEALQRI